MRNKAVARSGGLERISFGSPVSTSLDELVQLRSAAQALRRRVQKKSSAPMSGGSVSRRLGRGLDFSEVREYQPGDDVRMIDWKVTARSGNTHTKLFIEERERPVLLVVDIRAGMRFGTRGMYKSMLAARLAALLGWCAVSSHDRVGGFVFTDDMHSEIRPQAGRRGLMELFRAIHQSHLQLPSHGDEQLAKCLRRLRRGVHGGSTVVVLSDFEGFNEEDRSSLGRVLQTLDTVAVHICDPFDYKLPKPGRYPMSTRRESGQKRFTLNIASRAEQRHYHEHFKARQAALKELFAHSRHFYTMATTDAPLLDTASDILSRKPAATPPVLEQ